MPDITQIAMGNQIYDIKDAVARDSITNINTELDALQQSVGDAIPIAAAANFANADQSKIYVYTGDDIQDSYQHGHWYWYNAAEPNPTWEDGGVWGTDVHLEEDGSLTHSGYAADAKVTGNIATGFRMITNNEVIIDYSGLTTSSYYIYSDNLWRKATSAQVLIATCTISIPTGVKRIVVTGSSISTSNIAFLNTNPAPVGMTAPDFSSTYPERISFELGETKEFVVQDDMNYFYAHLSTAAGDNKTPMVKFYYIDTDATLTTPHVPADAKATGDKTTMLEHQLNLLEHQLNLDDVISIDFGNISSENRYVSYSTGEVSGASNNYGVTGYINIDGFSKIKYKRMGITSSSTSAGMAFYDASKTYITGLQTAVSQQEKGYLDNLYELAVPAEAVFARFTVFQESEGLGSFELYGMSQLQYKLKGLENTLLKPKYKEPFSILSLFKNTENLFSNFCNYLENGYYNASASNKVGLPIRVVSTSNWKGWLIRVKPNTTYTLGPCDYSIMFFDGNLYSDKVIATEDVSDSEPNTITSSPTSYWMALTQRTDRDMSEWMMVEGESYPNEYVSGYPEWVDLPKDPNPGFIRQTTFFGSNSKILVEFTGSSYTVTIPSGRIIMEKGMSDIIPSATITATTSKWISYDNVAKEWTTSTTVSNKELYTIGYVTTTKVIYLNAVYDILYSKTIAFMGDSITAGVATTKCYHEYLYDRYKWKCLNYGFGGSGYYRNSVSQSSGKIGFGTEGNGVVTTPENFFTPNNIVARLAELDPSTLDGIVIFAGTNDWGNNISVDNYISGIESAFEYCKTNLTTVPVLIITPIHRKNDTVLNSQEKTLREYVDILIQECQKYSMAYVDAMTMTGIYPDNDANKAAFFSVDTSGLHPDYNGHKRIASVIGETLKEVINCKDF